MAARALDKLMTMIKKTSGLSLLLVFVTLNTLFVQGAEPQQQDDLASQQLQLFLANGVMTIRNMIGKPEHLLLRDRVAKGEGNTAKAGFSGTWALDKSNSEGLPPGMTVDGPNGKQLLKRTFIRK